MVKPIELKERALRLIDSLCENESLDYFRQDEDGKVIESKESLFISQIYKLAHAACNTNCEHATWEKEIDDMYAEFVKNRLI